MVKRVKRNSMFFSMVVLLLLAGPALAAELVLLPESADLKGDVHLSGGLIQNWHNVDSSITWKIQFKKAGTVKVSLYEACVAEHSGSVVEMSLAGQVRKCTITSTGGWQDYQEKQLGAFNIPEAGKYKLVIKPLSKPHRAVANLSKVVMEGDVVEGAMVGRPRRSDIVSTFGWEGDKDAAIAFPGSFIIRDGRRMEVGFDIFDQHKTYKWYNHSGYLPCLVTEFEYDDCIIKIMNFGDKVRFGGHDTVIAYSRAAVTNTSNSAKEIDPEGSTELVRLNNPGTRIPAGKTVNFDYAIALDRFGKTHRMPTDQEIAAAGTWDEHFAHMEAYWNNKLMEIAQIDTPDQELNNAYKTGFIYTHIVKDGNSTHVGENGYDQVWDHDATGILTSLLTMGYFSEAKELLDVLPISLQYDDGTWKYSWPFSLYLLKTGDKEPVLKHWDNIKMSAHKIASDRTGPGGIMKVTNDIDTEGLWTVDNWSGMFGMACYKWLCEQMDEQKEAAWAAKQYDDFLKVVNKTLSKTVKDNGLNYIPASIVESNEKNRCQWPNDANWAAHFFFGRWAWDGWLVGARQEGPNLDLIDATYDYGFDRLKKAGFPPHTYGGYPGYSTAYNAGYAGAALRGDRYRTEGVRNYQFMISNAQSGPFSWWEGILNPSETTWEGIHPSGGSGSCPHMWGQSSISKVLLESITAEFYNGDLLIGRGTPAEWLAPDKIIRVSNFPIKGNKRIDVIIKAVAANKVMLLIDGDVSNGKIRFNLPVMVDNIASTTTGTIDNAVGEVVLEPGTSFVIVTLKQKLF